VDLGTDDVERALVARGFDRSVPAVFSCVGTTMYLAAEAMSALLKCVANCARGSELAFSCNVTREFMDAQGLTFLRAITPKLADQGEPVVTGFAPSAVEALISQHGLCVVDHPTFDDLFRRYCADRGEPIRPYTVERMMTARSS
jgi:O-methyltransferase involved in polyketide biosynthesis